MKSLKIFGSLFLLLIVLIGGVAFYFFSNINQIVKAIVEGEGPKVTQTKVLLRDVDIKPFEGSGELNNFVIGNPQGFTRENIVKWDKVRLQMDTSSFSGDVIVIKDFVVDGVKITAEQKGMTTNLQKLLDTLSSGSGSSGSDSGASASKSDDVRLMMERLQFTNNSIDFVTEKFGSYTLDLPSFELANLGDKSKGLTPQELGQAILEPLLEQAKKAVERRAKELTTEELKRKLEEKKAELEAKAKAKKAELEADVDAKKKELKADVDAKKKAVEEDLAKEKAKLEAEKQALEAKKKELESKKKEATSDIKKDAEDKLKGLLNR